MKKLLSLFLVAFLIFVISANAAVTLPKIFSDNMVLQRDVATKVWGWSEKGEAITVSFNGVVFKSKADKNGSWFLLMKPMAFGGPYEMIVKGKSNTITFKNILIGDVWVGSGQSNMEWTIKNTNNAEKEIANANHPNIRLFTVKKSMSYQPEKDVEGAWQVCSPNTIADFSAVAYFFGRKLNQDLNVPIGLINTSWGGTNIQTWMSWDIMSQKDAYKNVDISKLKQSASDVAEKRKQFDLAMKNEKGKLEKWFESSDNIGWKKINLPQMWEATEIGNADGYVWFKKEFEISSELTGTEATINLGPIDDQDETYLNGKLIGATNSYNEDRKYIVKAGGLKSGKNTIVIKVLDTGGGGGVYGKPEQMFLEVGQMKNSLAGEWLYKPSVLTTDFGIQDSGPNSFPSQLYNAMIAPIISYPIKGAIWYQGESNTGEAYRYRKLFPEMIKDWRSKWGSDFTFLWVQLANFMKPDSIPTQSNWAELREAQSLTMTLPKTGQAVIIDIGEEDDIHPRNKQDVGYRLALAALKVTYEKGIVYTGPVYKSMTSNGNKILLTFSEVGGGLMAKDKYGYLKGFAVAGDDKKFVWANAYIEGDKIVVSSPGVKNPVAVRYAWGNNPDDANLYNKEGLPASPFRTDTWPGISQGQ